MKNRTKKLIGACIISILLILLIYVSNITSIPNKIILFEGEKLSIKTVLGLNISSKNLNNYQTVEASSNMASKTYEKDTLTVSLFGKIPVKEIDVNILKNTEVIPLGNLIGLKLYTNGVLVVGMSEIEGEDSNKYKPYENCGIKEGDMIVKINEKEITCTADLIQVVEESKSNEIDITYIREGETEQTNITPIKTASNDYKIGLWVRDAAAGVGTMSFYEPSSGLFASLGHGILDIDTEELLNIATGEFVTTNIISVNKGEKGKPGKIQGTIENGEEVGKVYKNTNFGVYGKLNNLSVLNVNLNNKLKVGLRDEIEIGKASIRCTLENNVQKEYEIEIQKIYKNNNLDNKSMIIKVTDEELLEKTGGIIQGMSGSPIMQNNKVVGAVTHVLVSDPTMGYGVFADMMIKQMKSVE